MTATADRVSVLLVDGELADALPATRRRQAEVLSVARVVERPEGVWDAETDAALGRNGLGLLVVDGSLVCCVGTEARSTAELLSAGDVLQPDRHDGEAATLPLLATWKVLTPMRLAVLDEGWMRRMTPFPEVTSALAGRIMVRSRRLASQLAITQRHRLDERLQLMFWELADRYGRVGVDGVRLDIPLTHNLISQLVGAHRPSVSVALGRLEREGQLSRRDDRWLLHGEPPDPSDLHAR